VLGFEVTTLLGCVSGFRWSLLTEVVCGELGDGFRAVAWECETSSCAASEEDVVSGMMIGKDR